MSSQAECYRPVNSGSHLSYKKPSSQIGQCLTGQDDSDFINTQPLLPIILRSSYYNKMFTTGKKAAFRWEHEMHLYAYFFLFQTALQATCNCSEIQTSKTISTAKCANVFYNHYVYIFYIFRSKAYE